MYTTQGLVRSDEGIRTNEGLKLSDGLEDDDEDLALTPRPTSPLTPERAHEEGGSFGPTGGGRNAGVGESSLNPAYNSMNPPYNSSNIGAVAGAIPVNTGSGPISETKWAGHLWNSRMILEKKGRLLLLPYDDYIFSLYVDAEEGVLIGTIYGRILHYSFPWIASASGDQLTPSGWSLTSGAECNILQGFSEDAVRGLYLTKGKMFGIIGNHACWAYDRVTRKDRQYKFDRRISAQIKYVLQFENQILIPSLGVTIMHDLDSQTTLLCPLRLPDSDVIPLDYRDGNLISFIHAGTNGNITPAAIKVLKLPLTIEEPRWGTTVDCIFHQELPKNVTGLTKAKFWGADRIAFVTNGNQLYVFEISSGNRLAHWKTGFVDVILLDASNDNRLVSVDTSSRLRVWRLSSPLAHVYEEVLDSKFQLNQLYHSVQKENVFFYTADSELAFTTILL